MLSSKDIIADMHIHTLFSEHAYSTIKECIDSARNHKLKYLAITDHFYYDGTELNKKNEINRLRHLSERVNSGTTPPQVLSGAEFNLGQIIPNRDKLKLLDWKMVGLHKFFLNCSSLSLESLFGFFYEQSDWCDAFAHIEREIHQVEQNKHGVNLDEDIKTFLNKMVGLAKEKDVFLEVNEYSLISNSEGNIDRMKYWLSLAKQNGNNISLGSDAHYCEEVGCFPKAIDLLNEINYPIELILNCNPSLIEKLRNRSSLNKKS